MHFVFIDESGDLGGELNKQKTSRFFVIALLITENKRALEKIVRKAFASFTKGQKKSSTGALHCNKEQPGLRMRILKNLSEHNVMIMATCIEKKSLTQEQFEQKHIIYCNIISEMINRLESKIMIGSEASATIIASRRETNRYLNETIMKSIEENLPGVPECKFSVEMKQPHEEKCLQLADFVSWTIYRKFEHKDESYYKIIENRVEDIILWGQQNTKPGAL